MPFSHSWGLNLNLCKLRSLVFLRSSRAGHSAGALSLARMSPEEKKKPKKKKAHGQEKVLKVDASQHFSCPVS